MKASFIKILQDIIKQAQSNRDKKFLSDTILTLIEATEKLNLDPVNKSQLLNFVLETHSKIATENYLFYYNEFYYIYKKTKEDDEIETSKSIVECNILINLFRVKTFFSETLLTSSTDDYFFSRGIRLIWAFKIRPKQLTYPFIYLLLNYYQALMFYINKFKTTKYDELRNDYENILKQIYSNKLFRGNLSLIGFWNSTTSQLYYEDKDDLIAYGENEKRYLTSKLKYDTENALQLIDLKNIHFETQLTDLNLLIEYLIAIGQTEIKEYIPLFPTQYKRPLNCGLAFFIKNYQQSLNCDINEKDLNLLFKYDDSDLRSRIAALLINIDRSALSREIKKPHSGYEISDMEISFHLNNDDFYKLCIPVKSGREILNNIVEEKYAYQIYKPFSNFGEKCVVIFVTAKKISQSLDTYIKRMSMQVPWKVEVLQEKELCQVLKYNNLLN